jgi:hypothetical protein
MKVKIYKLDPYENAIKEAIEEHNLQDIRGYDRIIRKLGFPSCEFIPNLGKAADSHWEMDEIEFTWFALKFSR